MTLLPVRNRNQRQIEHEAFYHGAQGCNPTEALAEMESSFNQKMAATSNAAVTKVKQLEARYEDAEQKLGPAKERLEDIQSRLGGRLPEVAVPAFMVAVGIFGMLAESVMLAPFMDAFDITVPIEQRFAALAIGGACAVFLHLALESLNPKRFTPLVCWLYRLAGMGCLFGLIIAGIARGHHAAYGASISDSPLAGFLQKYPLLGIMVYAFLTVTFPLATALGITSGVKAVREWRELLAARHAVQHLTTAATESRKQLEAEQKKLDHDLKELQEKSREWQKAYLVQHERGTAIGGTQDPKWMIALKASFVALIAMIVSALTIGWRAATAVLTVTAYIGAWLYFYRVWINPKPHQFFNQQNVRFRNTSGGEQ